MFEESELTTCRFGDTELVLCPGMGGSVVSLRVGGADVLRPGSRDALENRDPLGLAAFPLFPFSGRIANGRFRCGSQEIVLRPNFPPEPHAIHGQAWQNAWHLAEGSEDSAVLVYEHDGDDWPWAYRAEQHFVVAENGLELSMSLTNLSDAVMPAGLGWHPYFPKDDALLQADVTEIWLSGEDMIPEHPAPLEHASDLRSLRAVARLNLDNGFNVGNAASLIRWQSRGGGVSLSTSSELRHLVVFTPPGEDYFCVEPTSHAPDAVNSTLAAEITGHRVLEPGEMLSAEITLDVETPDAP